MPIIEVDSLVKDFVVKKKKKGLKGSISALLFPEKSIVRAVNNISFNIEQGEIVGYIGPNGAGKSTTIKMMTGILHPTLGHIKIDGKSPQDDRKAVVCNLGVVFGQRSQLYWDLRTGESFELLKRIYRIEDKLFDHNLNLMNQIVGINELLDVPVRQLSLGQRMRADLAASMLHSPRILFLDEPTIGLDIEVKHAIRKFILDINKREGTTVILTTHDIGDVEKLCNRIIVINKGIIIEDGTLQSLINRLALYRYLVVDLLTPQEKIEHKDAEVYKKEGLRVWFRFDKSKITASTLISELIQRYPIQDVSIREPDIEEVIKAVYKNEKIIS